MPVAVLLHGGFHGGWCWSRVAARLRATGWTVYAPSLTGLADRAHLLTPEVGLETHALDIVRLIECEELSEVTLCAHSAGGMVATLVADRIPERLAQLVYLDATVPRPGESLMDVMTDAQGVPDLFRSLAAAEGDGFRVPAAVFSAGDFGVVDPQDAEWVQRRMSAHPLRAFEDPAEFDRGHDAVARRTYIRCERFPIAFGEPLVARFERDPGWRTARWDEGHHAMITAPARVVAAITGFATE